MVGELDEFGVQASNVAILSSAEPWKVRLECVSPNDVISYVRVAYVNVKSKDRIFLPSSLETGDLGL